jgi:hypothetical protein
LLAIDIADNVAPGGHVAFTRFALGDIYDVVKEVSFAVLAAEVLGELARARGGIAGGRWRGAGNGEKD